MYNDVCPACIAVLPTKLDDCVPDITVYIVPYLDEASAKPLQHLLKQQFGPSNEPLDVILDASASSRGLNPHFFLF